MLDVFATNLTRKQLIEASKDSGNGIKIRINVHRNHAFEPIQSLIKPFLDFSKLNATFNLGSYDDSFMFDAYKSCDLELLWIDLDNYRQYGAVEHIFERVQYLRSVSKSPILIIFLDIFRRQNMLFDNLESIKDKFNRILDVNFFLISELLGEMHWDSILDEIKSKITGMRLSNIACIKIAQILGLSLIPSMVLPTLKAVVLDLDGTLYGGILGEDGWAKIVYNAEYAQLHDKILKYKSQGFLLAIASKNDIRDVKELFLKRKDFQLKLEDFDCIKSNWNTKIQNLQEIAETFNIGLDSILFIDDNLAEIESVRTLGVKTILAKSPLDVVHRLNLFPQMLKLAITKEDRLRTKDIQANTLRQELVRLSPKEYFEKLEIELEFRVNAIEALLRITELLNKTNQFIANYTRPTQEIVKEWLKHQAVITIAMRDKLSNSGIIGIVVCFKGQSCLEVMDFCVSCRALGRKLEKIMFFKACVLAKQCFAMEGTILLHYQKGQRNLPFLHFLDTLQTKPLSANVVRVESETIETKGLLLKEIICKQKQDV